MIISKYDNKVLSLFMGTNKDVSCKSTRFIKTSIITFLLLNLAACDNNNELPSPRHGAKQSLHRVEVVVVENRSVSLKQIVSGTLEAVTKIRLYNEESGRIIKLPFHEGDVVKKGTLLVQLDNSLLKVDLAKAKASHKQAKLDLSRIKKLVAKKIATEEEVAKIQTALELARAEENRQSIRLQRTSIKAPINGLITQRFFEPGDLLPPQSQILTIIDPATLQLKANLAERWIPLVKKDQNVTLRIDALGDSAFAAKITRIHPTINTTTHNGTVEIELNPVPDGAYEGQFSRADIELTATNRLVIPVHTIHYEPKGAYVYRIVEKDNDDKSAKQPSAEKVYFEQGQQFGSVIEVLTELSVGDKIVSRGYLGLRDGKKVIIANEENPTPSIEQEQSLLPSGEG